VRFVGRLVALVPIVFSGALFGILAALPASITPAWAGSLDDFLRAYRPASQGIKGQTVEDSLTAINNFTAALDTDLTDRQLTRQQRTQAIYQRAYHWMTLYKCDEAIPGFSTLIDGTDPLLGELEENDPLYAASYKWRAVCRYTVFDLQGAMGDIAQARRLQPSDYTIRRMDMEMMLSSLPAEG
jgi:hypothetical protein